MILVEFNYGLPGFYTIFEAFSGFRVLPFYFSYWLSIFIFVIFLYAKDNFSVFLYVCNSKRFGMLS